MVSPDVSEVTRKTRSHALFRPLPFLLTLLAIVIGIASLGASLGLTHHVLFVALLAMVVAAGLLPIVIWWMNRRSSDRSQPSRPVMAYAGVGEEAMVPLHYFAPQTERPAHPAAPVIRPASRDVAPHPVQQIPGDFDVEGFVDWARRQYLQVQAAHDNGDLDHLREYTAHESLADVRDQLKLSRQTGNAEFPELVAQLLAVRSTSLTEIASVRFRGKRCLVGASELKPFDEVWDLSRPCDAGGSWLLARIQPLR